MPPKPLPISKRKVLAEARKLSREDTRPSLAKLAARLGFKANTLGVKLADEGWRGEVDSLLKARVAAPREVADPLRLKVDQQDAALKALRRENTAYAKELASREAFFDRIVETLHVPVEPPKLKVAAQDKALPARRVVAPIFDVQLGQLILPEDTPSGRGAYSLAIFEKRLARWYEGVTGSLRDYAESHRITSLTVPLGGDFVEGHGIFAGQEWKLEIDPARQVWEFASKFGGADGGLGTLQHLIRFAKQELGVPKIDLYAVPGNHGKVGGKKAGALHSTHSWDWLCAKLLKDKLRAEPIDSFEIEPGGKCYFRVGGSVFLMIHGDEIKGSLSIPFYGASRYDSKAIRAGHVIHDYLMLGHHHTPAEIEQGGGGETLWSGAWVGDSELSRFMGAASRPQQRVYFLAEKWGISEVSRIYFDESDVARSPARVHG